MKWALGYADGSIVKGDTDTDEMVDVRVPRAWLEAPPDGVILMATERPSVGRVIFEGKDCFYWMANPHPGAGEPGTADNLGVYLRYQGLVKYGVWVDTPTWADRHKRFREAIEDHMPSDRPAAPRHVRIGEKSGKQDG